MNAVSRIRAEVVEKAEAERRLADQIAHYLAEQNKDDVCRVYQSQADEILAMVREASQR